MQMNCDGFDASHLIISDDFTEYGCIMSQIYINLPIGNDIVIGLTLLNVSHH